LTVFWDTSALVPLIIEQQPFTEQGRALAARSSHRVIAFFSELEGRTALERLHRDGAIATRRALQRAHTSLSNLLRGFDVVRFQPKILADATVLVDKHPLRTLDSLQLASCKMLLASFGVAEVSLVTADRRLATAARAELRTVLLLGDNSET
jgi:predicted nucleic acid-binding protein